MTKDARVTPALRTRLTAAASGALLLLALGAAPAMARTAVHHSPADVQVEPTGVQVEEVTSSSPVRVSDLEAAPAGVSETYYCVVVDGTYGCHWDLDPNDGLVVAELFEHAGFGGWRVVISNPAYAVGCTSSVSDHQGGSDLGPSLENRVSSVKTYNHCDVRLFDREGWNGGNSGWIDRYENLGTGSFNDWADSVAIS